MSPDPHLSELPEWLRGRCWICGDAENDAAHQDMVCGPRLHTFLPLAAVLLGGTPQPDENAESERLSPQDSEAIIQRLAELREDTTNTKEIAELQRLIGRVACRPTPDIYHVAWPDGSIHRERWLLHVWHWVPMDILARACIHAKEDTGPHYLMFMEPPGYTPKADFTCWICGRPTPHPHAETEVAAARKTLEVFHDHVWTHLCEAQAAASGGIASSPRPTDCHKLDTADRVFFYEQDFYVLSNFSAFALDWAGHLFPTSEHAYHWMKFDWVSFGAQGTSPSTVKWGILGALSAHAAFKLAEEYRSVRRPDWDAVKVDIMRDILRAKAQQHEYVRRKLLATGDRELVEDSWRDDFWGWGPNRDGQNMLGRLWMEIRAELRPAASVSLTRYGCHLCAADYDHDPVTWSDPGIPAVTYFFCSVDCRSRWLGGENKPPAAPVRLEPQACRTCGGSGFVAEKRCIDDGYGEVDSCPTCVRPVQEKE